MLVEVSSLRNKARRIMGTQHRLSNHRLRWTESVCVVQAGGFVKPLNWEGGDLHGVQMAPAPVAG